MKRSFVYFKIFSFYFLLSLFSNSAFAEQSIEAFLEARDFKQSPRVSSYFRDHFINQQKKIAVLLDPGILMDSTLGYGLGDSRPVYFPPSQRLNVFTEIIISVPTQNAIRDARNVYPGFVWETAHPNRVAKNTLNSFLYRSSLSGTPYGRIVAATEYVQLAAKSARNEYIKDSLEYALNNSPVHQLYPAAKFLEDFDTYTSIWPHLSESHSFAGSKYLTSLAYDSIYAPKGKAKTRALSRAYDFMMDNRVRGHDIYSRAGGASKQGVLFDALDILRKRKFR